MKQVNFAKEMARVQRYLEMLRTMRSRMWFANPDLCIFLSNYQKWGFRYLKKRGAKKGHFMVGVGWLTFSVAW